MNGINSLIEYLKENEIDPRRGLPQELFWIISALTPIPNVDLFILDNNNRLLLSWRDDSFYGKGWHLVGGCIRMHETMHTRIIKTAEIELGTGDIQVCDSPIMVKDAIVQLDESDFSIQNMIRTHNVSVLYKCRLDDNFSVEDANAGKSEYDAGYLKWFDHIPDDLLPAFESVYGELLLEWEAGNITW